MEETYLILSLGFDKGKERSFRPGIDLGEAGKEPLVEERAERRGRGRKLVSLPAIRGWSRSFGAGKRQIFQRLPVCMPPVV